MYYDEIQGLAAERLAAELVQDAQSVRERAVKNTDVPTGVQALNGVVVAWQIQKQGGRVMGKEKSRGNEMC